LMLGLLGNEPWIFQVKGLRWIRYGRKCVDVIFYSTL
jgi:hypothetical protein